MRSRAFLRAEQLALGWDAPGLVAGVDEAGRGPLAGPVVAAAVMLDDLQPIRGLADSKKLGPKTRERLFDEIRARALCCCIAEASVEEIDRLNILQATLLAMRRAVEGLRLKPHRVLVDGNRLPVLAVPAELGPDVGDAQVVVELARFGEDVHDGAGQALTNHAERIADQNTFDAGGVRHGCKGRVVSRQHGDFFAMLMHLAQPRQADRFALRRRCCGRQGAVSRR